MSTSSGHRPTAIGGFVKPQFQPVADAFARNFETGDEEGAACAVYLDGEPVLDLWGGMASSGDETPWQEDTLTPVFSVGKGLDSIGILHLADRGALDLDAPVARYWPAFGVHGKDRVTVRQSLAHRAGVPLFDGPLTMDDLADPDGLAARLAEQRPYFEPGEHYFYHAWTLSLINSEIIRAAGGMPTSPWIRANLAEPLDAELWLGLPDALRPRVAVLEESATPLTAEQLRPQTPMEIFRRRGITCNYLFSLRPGEQWDFNSKRIQRLQLTGGSMVSNARSLARVYGACTAPVNGVRLLSPEMLREGLKPVSTGHYWNFSVGTPYAAGFKISVPDFPMLGESSFGHDGGPMNNIAFGHADSRVSFAYVRNRTAPGNVAARGRVIAALAGVVGAPGLGA